MFQYSYPQFQIKRLLRVEMLEQLRDYPATFLNLAFAGFANGVISGCDCSWNDDLLTIHPGMVLWNSNIYFMKNPFCIHCRPEDGLRYLKIQFLKEGLENGIIMGNSKIYLDKKEPIDENEMELCRFRLQEGARLRDEYATFEDYSTEYDTLNLIHVPYAGEESATLNPKLLNQYAKETIDNRVTDSYDVSFAMNILANNGTIKVDCICAYLSVKLGKEMKYAKNQELYCGLLKVLKGQQSEGRKTENEGSNRRGIMLL